MLGSHLHITNVVWMWACPINCMRAGRLIPARTISEAKVVSKATGVCERDTGGVAMVAEQGAQSGSGQRVSREGPFTETNNAALQGWFQPQVMIQQLSGLRSQRQKVKFLAFAAHGELGFGEGRRPPDSKPILRLSAFLRGALTRRWPGRAPCPSNRTRPRR